MDNNSNISPSWASFRKLWLLVAIILFILLLILMFLGYGPGGNKSKVPVTIVEKIVEKEKLVDNPELLTRIGLLEKENAQIALLKIENAQISGLKSNVANLTKTSGLVAGLQAKVKALEAVDLNFENPILVKRISLLESENAQISELKSNVANLTKTSGLVAGLQAKVKALEAVDLNFENPTLMKRISLLENENAQISGLKSNIANLTKTSGLVAGLQAKVKALEAVDLNFENPTLMKRISLLENENAQIPVLKSNITDLTKTSSLVAGLQAKAKALEALDINFIKPEDNTQLLQKISSLETKNLVIPVLESRIDVLEAKEPTLVSKISKLEKENSLIAGLKAKVSALEAIDVNFIKSEANTQLLQKISSLETKNLVIPILESRIKDLESQEPTVVIKEIDNPVLLKRIDELETQNGLIPGLKAKIEALEEVDINFIKNSASVMAVPGAAKLYFESGSSHIPTDVSQSMADVIVYLRSNPSSTVSLAGFHDASGTANWNHRLALRRSNRVKQVLINAGISNDRINVERPTQTLGKGLPRKARHVEIIISK